MQQYLRANREKWDELVPLHLRSPLYDLDSFRAGRSSLLDIERDEIGDVAGKSLLHLQCHFGQDTLSLARLGAKVTGLDFSAVAIDAARVLASEIAVEGEFVHSDLYEAPAALGGRQFDIVYTGGGAITWLPDIERWAEVVARCLAPGGTLYLREFHPFLWVFDAADGVESLQVRYPYFHSDEPMRWDEPNDYADPNATVEHSVEYGWAHPLGDVVTAIARAGLVIEFLHEHDFVEFHALPFMQRGDDGRWRLPEHAESVPLQYSLRAHKPQ